MGRREQREQLFKLLFRLEFNAPEEMPEQVKLFMEDNEEIVYRKDADYISEKFSKIQERVSEIDQLINANTEGWDVTRMGKVELTTLRLAVYEIVFDEDVPGSVAINEAVELAKKYGQDTSGGFVNAILGKIEKARHD